MLFFGARTRTNCPTSARSEPAQRIHRHQLRVLAARPALAQALCAGRRCASAPPTCPCCCQDANTCFYVCGLKSMEEGVVLALRDVAQQAGLDWDAVGRGAQVREARLHLETY